MSHFTIPSRRSPSTRAIQLTSYGEDTSHVEYICALERNAGRIQRAAVQFQNLRHADQTAPTPHYMPSLSNNSQHTTVAPFWTLKLEFSTPEAADTAYAAVAEHGTGISTSSPASRPFPMVPGGFVIAERLACFVLEDGDSFINPRDLTNTAGVDWSTSTHRAQSGSLSPRTLAPTQTLPIPAAPVGARRSNNTRGDVVNSASPSSTSFSTLHTGITGHGAYTQVNHGMAIGMGFEIGHARAYSFGSEDGGYTSSSSSLVSSTTASSSERTSPYLSHFRSASSLSDAGFGGSYGHIGYGVGNSAGYTMGSGALSIHMPEVLDDFDELALSMSNLDVATPVVGTNKQRAPWQPEVDIERDEPRVKDIVKQQPLSMPATSVQRQNTVVPSTATTTTTAVTRPAVASYSNALRKSLPAEMKAQHTSTHTTGAYHRHHLSDARSESSTTTTHTKHSTSSSSSSSTNSPHSRQSHSRNNASGTQHRKAPRQDKRLYAVDPHQGPRPTDWMLSEETLASRAARDARFAQIVEAGLAKGRTKAGWAQARRPGKRDRDAAKAKLRELEEEKERERLRALLGESQVTEA